MWRHRSIFVRGWPYTKGHRGKLIAMVVLTGVGAVLPLLSPWPLAFLIDNVLGEKSYPSAVSFLSEWGPMQQIIFAVAVMFAIEMLSQGFGILQQYIEAKYELAVVLDYRSALFEKAQSLPLPYLDEQRAGSFIFQINYHAHSMGSLVTHTLPMIQQLLTVVGALVITWMIAPALALISMVTIPFVVMSTTLYSKWVEPSIEHVRELEGGSLNIVHESMAMIRVVVAFCRERFEHDSFRENGTRGMDARVALTMRQTIFMAAVTLITTLGTAVAIAYGAYLVIQGKATVGYLYVVLNYMGRVYQPLEGLSHQIGAVQVEFINLKATFKILDAPAGVQDRPGAPELPPVRGAIEFDRVTYRYPNGHTALHDVSFQVAPGETVAVVGPTGAGKTTLAGLLSRLVDPEHGRVLIDGQDLTGVTVRSVREQVAVVNQEPLLFARPIIENIQYGREGASTDEAVQAAIDANAHDFIMGLPNKYGTLLGDRGAGISGGERQRITIARAFLKDAPILILDEPTASIDSRTEQVILDSLDRLAAGRTTFVIAHRLSTVTHADRIVVLDHGRLVEQGTHESLLAHDGLYAEMWRSQTSLRPARKVELDTAQVDAHEADAVPVEAPDGPPPYRGAANVEQPQLAAAFAGGDGLRAMFDSGAMRQLLDGEP
jgi:ABC-type multidrug transport system fused ATPase/permease subunit